MSKYSEELGYGDGSMTVFTVPFKYLAKDHVKVYVDGEEVSFEWLTDFSISITPAPAAGVPVLRRRITPIDKAEVDFRDGSNLEERDLDVQSDQLLFVTQEANDALTSRLAEDATGEYDALDKRIQNVADPVEPADAVNKQYADQTLDAVEADRIAAEVARVGAEAAQVAAETAQGASETAQGQSEANALASAASAQEAQDWVDMIGRYEVIRITSNYNLTAANLGNMIAVDASAGPVDVIVPSIAVLGEPFHWRVKKIDVTTNQVRVVSPDKIDGFDDPYVITATNAGATFQTDNDVENNIVTSAFGASANVVSRPFFFTATEGQTTFTGPDDYGNTLAYTPGKLNQVAVDGDVIDTRGMTAADGISIVFHEPLVAGQQVFCEPFASFVVANTLTVEAAQNMAHPIGSLYISATDDNPAVTLGFGTWSLFAQGQTLIGVGTHTDDRAEERTFAAGDQVGEYKHLLTQTEMPSHTHGLNEVVVAAGAGGIVSNNGGTGTGRNVAATGGGAAHNNMQPSIAVYFWKRDA